MIKAKHTTGPWEIKMAKLINDKYYAAGAEHKILPPGYDGKKHLPITKVFASSDKAEANVHLIAAAPELLEALEDYLYAANHPEFSESMLRGANIKARAAIAKAKGA